MHRRIFTPSMVMRKSRWTLRPVRFMEECPAEHWHLYRNGGKRISDSCLKIGVWRRKDALWNALNHWSEVMILHVREAKYLRDYVIWLRFNDGAEGEIDLEPELEGEMFAPLKDVSLFKKFRVDPDLQTIAWENGADLAPEFLYENMRVLA